MLDAELRGLGLAKARHQGLPPEWVARLAEWDPERRQVRSASIGGAPTCSSAVDDAKDGPPVRRSGGDRCLTAHSKCAVLAVA